jgi:hypothetical protein
LSGGRSRIEVVRICTRFWGRFARRIVSFAESTLCFNRLGEVPIAHRCHDSCIRRPRGNPRGRPKNSRKFHNAPLWFDLGGWTQEPGAPNFRPRLRAPDGAVPVPLASGLFGRLLGPAAGRAAAAALGRHRRGIRGREFRRAGCARRIARAAEVLDEADREPSACSGLRSSPRTITRASRGRGARRPAGSGLLWRRADVDQLARAQQTAGVLEVARRQHLLERVAGAMRPRRSGRTSVVGP